MLLQPRTCRDVKDVDFLFEDIDKDENRRHFMEDVTNTILTKMGITAELYKRTM